MPAVLLSLLALLWTWAATAQTPVPHTIWSPEPGFVPPPIVLQHDPATGSGADWAKADSLLWYSSGDDVAILRAAIYLREGIAKMTGQTLPVVSTNDLSKGIVLTTLANAPAELRDDPRVREALRNTGEDSYNDREAYLVRTEADRTLLIANTPAGLAAAVVELLESVDYEVLGMGPNWVHAPDYTTRPLIFALDGGGRPSYYIRSLWATSGQQRGVGTLMTVDDPADEPVNVSYQRWQLGTRMFGSSMPSFPGHAMQAYHQPVADRMLATGTTEGFLMPSCAIGPEADRPEASPDNQGTMWIASERNAKGQALVFISDGKAWNAQNTHSFHANLDLSVPLVREVILEAAKERVAKAFEAKPDQVAVIGTDPEDGGGYGRFAALVRYPNWYPDYRVTIGDPLGKPYVLHGYNGLDQPTETWDTTTPCDTVFGFSNWLLRELDDWLASLPEAEQRTATGQWKRDLLRCSFYSYNYHDVPPNFNLDPRIRVMIAGYPKHRGRGKWANFANQRDMARAFQVMLPREPSGDYRIISLAYYWDPGPGGVPARWSAAPDRLAADYGATFAAGIKAMSIETDLNFGKFGLAYYLITKLLWNADLTGDELDTLRDRWLHRAYGSAWEEMKAYYDYLLPENYPVNGPNSWAIAIRMIDQASQKLAASGEVEAHRRLDDLKQYWYYHYLVQSGQHEPPSDAMRTFAWKGQMAYMVAMHMVMRRVFKTNDPRQAAGPDIATGPAHYTAAETAEWWQQVLDFWPVTDVLTFREQALANGHPAAGIDLNDLVSVAEFQGGPADAPFLANSFDIPSNTVLTIAAKADEPIGFKLVWPYNPEGGEAYMPRAVAYGMQRWNATDRIWEELIDKTMTNAQSVEAARANGAPVQVVEVQLPAPGPGVYRFDVGRGGRLANLASLGYDSIAGTYASSLPFSYSDVTSGLTQSPVWFYLPKGTKRLDFEIHDTHGGKTLVLHTGLPASGLKASRQLDVSRMGTHTVDLEPGEAGSLAMLRSNGFAFPYMYSIYPLWAKSPAALLVPRAIAEADGLTIQAP